MPDAAASDMTPIFLFFHSLLRWGLLLTVAGAGIVALLGWLRQGPVLMWHRSLAIWGMVLCHVQLVIGFALYFMRMDSFKHLAPDQARYWKFEHMGMMLIAIALVTIGRLASKKANTDKGKQMRVAIFYLLALVVMLVTIPWPFTAMGEGRGWL